MLSERLIPALALAFVALTPAVAQDCTNDFSFGALNTLANSVSSPKIGSAAMHPKIGALGRAVLESYACKEFVNYYAEKTGLPNDIVHGEIILKETEVVLEMSNRIFSDVCGEIRYDARIALEVSDSNSPIVRGYFKLVRGLKDIIAAPLGLADHSASPEQNKKYKEFLVSTNEAFMKASGDLAAEAQSMAHRFTPDGKGLSRPTTENVDAILGQFQKDLVQLWMSLIKQSKWSDDDVTRFIGLAKCAPILPTATGPNRKVFSGYSAAYQDYVHFTAALEKASK